MENREVARILRETAQLLEIDGAMIGRYRSYERAAELLGRPARIRRRAGARTAPSSWNCPASAMAWPITFRKFSRPATIPCERKLLKKYPETILHLLELQSLGPKKVAFLWKTFKAGTVEQVEKLAREGKLRDLAGFGEKSEENILKAIEVYKKSAGPISHRRGDGGSGKARFAFIRAFGKPIEVRDARRLAAARQGNRRRPRPAGYDGFGKIRAEIGGIDRAAHPRYSRKSTRSWRTARTRSAFC